ncbi:hypothetical protein Goshw_019343, partial [Gossypium schwendimanii]|nr:hypothetical protein [Gossypium schwendimanii]
MPAGERVKVDSSDVRSFYSHGGMTSKKWMAILQNLREEDIKWRASWLLPNEILYRCDNFDW